MSMIRSLAMCATEDGMNREALVLLTKREQQKLMGGVGGVPLKPPPNEGGSGPDGGCRGEGGS